MSEIDIKQGLVGAAVYFDGLLKAAKAVKASRSLGNPHGIDIKCLQEAADYYYDEMVNCLDLALEEICINAEIEYRAAKDGRVVPERVGPAVQS